jgi:sulfide:quinone oxidoreductase
MKIMPLSPDYAVASQIWPEDVAGIAAQGYRAIMCNRPDNEEPGQPAFAEIASAADAAGLKIAHVPVVSGGIVAGDVAAFAAALADLPAPVLAYCRSGARCQHLWTLAG